LDASAECSVTIRIGLAERKRGTEEACSVVEFVMRGCAETSRRTPWGEGLREGTCGHGCTAAGLLWLACMARGRR